MFQDDREIANALKLVVAKPPRRVALVGTASTGAGAPFDDPAVEIWGVSARAPYVKRADRWFELHRLDGEPPEWARTWRETMKGFTSDIGEVLMLWPEAKLAPKVTAYPYERIAKRFGTYFMTSTFSWMMALAIDEMRPLNENGFPRAHYNGDEIFIFGVEMEFGTEYRCQRSGFKHMMQVARMLGITVTRDVAGGLDYEPAPYPFWQDDPHLCKLERRHAEIKNGLRKLEDSHRANELLLAQDRAVLQELNVEMARPEYDKALRRTQLEEEVASLKGVADRLARDIIAHAAVEQEQAWHIDYLRPS